MLEFRTIDEKDVLEMVELQLTDKLIKVFKDMEEARKQGRHGLVEIYNKLFWETNKQLDEVRMLLGKTKEVEANREMTDLLCGDDPVYQEARA